MKTALLCILATATSVGAYSTVAAQSSGPPSPEQIARMRTIGMVRANIGNSGLRRFLSESASLGELQNRAASYRMIEQVERSRVAQLEGRITAIEAALRDPGLPEAERLRLEEIVEASRRELAAVPAYRAEYMTSTAQTGSLVELGFLSNRPIFMFVKGRFVHRTDPDDFLRVLAGRLDLAPTIFLSNRLFASVGVTVSRNDVDVIAFDGTSGTTSLGFRFDVGTVLSHHWSAGVHGAHTWASGRVSVVRPGPEPVPIVSEPSTHTTSVKMELLGRYDGDDLAPVPGFVELFPRLGAYAMRTSYNPVRNSLGETGTGLFGDSDALAIVAAGVALGFDTGGRLVPDLYIGMDHELPSEMSDVLADREGIVVSGGLTYRIARSRRVGVTYTYTRSTGGRRDSGEIDLVGVLDF